MIPDPNDFLNEGDNDKQIRETNEALERVALRDKLRKAIQVITGEHPVITLDKPEAEGNQEQDSE